MRFVRDDMHAMGHRARRHMGMSESEMGMDMDTARHRGAHPFDRAFLDHMIQHHAERSSWPGACSTPGEQPALREMARHMIETQINEVDRMRAWRGAWYGR